MSVFRSKLTSDNYLLYGTIRLLAAGVLISFVVVGIYNLSFSESSKQPRIQATVVDNEEHVLGSGAKPEETLYTPVLEYTVKGQTYITKQGVQATSQPYLLGQKIEIQYDPLVPSRTFQPAMPRSRALIALATVIAIPGISLFIRTLKQMVAIRRNNL